jgi:hypothetical protein
MAFECHKLGMASPCLVPNEKGQGFCLEGNDNGPRGSAGAGLPHGGLWKRLETN